MVGSNIKKLNFTEQTVIICKSIIFVIMYEQNTFNFFHLLLFLHLTSKRRESIYYSYPCLDFKMLLNFFSISNLLVHI